MARRTAMLMLVIVAACGSRTDMPSAGGTPSPAASNGRCGDGALDPGEECDDGDPSDDDACTTACKKARCGDGVVFTTAELCDDGNLAAGDGCSGFCGPETCGDGVVQGKEVCDDGNTNDGDRCLPSCLPASCGDGIVSAGEECDEGAANRDQPAFLLSQPGGPETPVRPVVSPRDAVQYYEFFSASGHTGLERAEESRAWLHVDSSRVVLSLLVSHGIDENGSQNQPDGQVEMDILGVPRGAFVALSDDPSAEFAAVGSASVRGRWRFSRNTDGGILTALPFPGSWTITVDARFLQGVGSWRWVDGDLVRRTLSLDERATLRAFDRPSACRPTCRRPRCGDGILDGGEVCDGDSRCSLTCKSFE